MIPVEQRQRAIFDANGDNVQRGDCLTACVAAIFEVPIDEVPFFVEADTWWEDYQQWLLERGFILRHYSISVDQDDSTILRGSPGPIYWIATVKSPRGKTRCSVCKGPRETSDQWNSDRGEYDHFEEPQPCAYCGAIGLVPSLHAVVMFGHDLVWDPHPERAMGHLGFVSGEQFGVVDPAKFALKAGS